MFNRLINRSYMAEERISENKGLSIETSKTEMQLRKKKKDGKEKKNRISKNFCGITIERHIICVMAIAEEEEQNRRNI